MVAYKHITKLISVIVAAAVVVCVLALMFPERVAETFGEGGVALRYEAELFDTSRIMEIDIQMDEEQWSPHLSPHRRNSTPPGRHWQAYPTTAPHPSECLSP